MKDVATFNTDGTSINNLKKVNYIYGANGSGKTTISNFLKSPNDEKYKHCSVSWENDSPLETLVFNRTFREQNFNSTSKIAGVFTLGNATIEQKKAIEDKKIKLAEIEKDGKQKKESKEKLEKDKNQRFEDFCKSCWYQIYKKNEALKEAFRGYLDSKKHFAEKIVEEYNNNKASICTIEEINEKAKTLFIAAPSSLSLLDIGDISFESIENDELWKKKIIGKSDVDIAPLIQKLNLYDWVNQGRQFIQEKSDICPFCQKKTIDESFRKKIEDYFDETFINDTDKIKELAARYITSAQNLTNALRGNLEKEINNKQTKLDNSALKALTDTLEQQYNRNIEIINNKIKEPSRSFELVSTQDQLHRIKALISAANAKIEEHNKLVANFQTEKSNLTAVIWKFLIEENKTLIDSFVKKDNGLKKGIEALDNKVRGLREQYRTLKDEISRDNKNVTSVQPAIDEINRILNLYGFTNFSIVPTDDNSYQIQRENGDIAQHTLSEGEITFITFLYYMQLVHGGTSAENANDNKILVIDDPISSLDGTILFVVSSLIKEEIKLLKTGNSNVKQIIILTHNIYFHKEVSFIDGKTKENDDTWFWIIRRNCDVSTIQCFEKSNPIQGSYELLWDELKCSDKLSNVTIQNTMRRIYETYFRILGKFSDNDVLDKFDNSQDREICRSLLCWINDGSHCIPDDLHIGYQEDNREKYLQVFKLIFDKMGHIEHYNMMMGITNE
ncbi:MAG: AAA family ATPase [Bacteroidales bacterium]|nr:AAA family ATPase [Bacteroidales bacterium]